MEMKYTYLQSGTCWLKFFNNPALIFILFLYLTSLYHQVQSEIEADQITLSIKCCSIQVSVHDIKIERKDLVAKDWRRVGLRRGLRTEKFGQLAHGYNQDE